MAELFREIEAVDLPKLHDLMKIVFDDCEWHDIKRLGGMTNHSYKITRSDGQEYLVRIPGEGTEEMINRFDERKSTELACKLNIDSPLLFFGDDGRKVMKFIHDPQSMDEEVIKRPEILRQAAEIFHKLHTCGIDTGVRFLCLAAINQQLIDTYCVVKGKFILLFTKNFQEKFSEWVAKSPLIEYNKSEPKAPCSGT